jgi:hypothetical protein
MLHQLAENLWVVQRPQRFYGLEVGSRMTVMRLESGSLLLHSPVALDAQLRREIDALGTVRYAVAPNRFHHLHAGDVARVYPEARLWVAAGVERKRPDLRIAGVLSDEAPAEWKREVDQLYFRGRPFENEVVFLHRPSRTLVLCDLAFNFGSTAPLVTRLVMTLLGGYGCFRPTRLDSFLIRDRQAARRSLEQILMWDFDRVVVAHGDVLESGGREALRAGYRWLLAE